MQCQQLKESQKVEMKKQNKIAQRHSVEGREGGRGAAVRHSDQPCQRLLVGAEEVGRSGLCCLCAKGKAAEAKHGMWYEKQSVLITQMKGGGGKRGGKREKERGEAKPALRTIVWHV